MFNGLKYKGDSDMTEITKWEYVKILSGSSEEIFNELGKQGYEVAGMDNGYALLKRPCGRLKVIEKVNGKEINPEQSQSQDTTYDR